MQIKYFLKVKDISFSKPNIFNEIFNKISKPFLLYAIALFIVLFGLFSIPPRLQPGNGFNEPIWLFHSLCLDAVFTTDYQESCREYNIQGLDHSAGAKYFLGLIRWFANIPSEAVKYDYHTGVAVTPDPDLRTTVMIGVAFFSCISLLVLFAILQFSFNYTVAFSGLTLILITPFWHLNLNTIAAEPFIILASILVWAGTMVLAKLLTSVPSKPTWLILITAFATGIFLGYSIGVKPNGALPGLGLGIILLYLFIRQISDWFLYLWICSLLVVGTVITLFSTNPILWGPDLFDRLKLYLNFRVILQFSEFTGYTRSPIESFPDAINSSFQLPFYTAFPPEITILFCLLGLWAGWKTFPQTKARVSYLFLVIPGLVNAFLLPTKISDAFNYYQIFTNFTTTLLEAIGLAFAIKFIFGKIKYSKIENFDQIGLHLKKGIARHYRWYSLVFGSICILVAGIIILTFGTVYLKSSKERKAWQEYVSATSWDKKIDQLVNLAEMDPKQPILSQLEGGALPVEAGKPLLNELVYVFDLYSKVGEPDYLKSVAKAGGLLRKDSLSQNVTNLVDYQQEKINKNSDLLIFSNNFFNSNQQVLSDTNKPATFKINLPHDGNFRLNVQGLNSSDGPVLVGVRVDKEFVGLLNFDHENNVASKTTIEFNSLQGTHNIQFYLPKIPEMFNRTAQVYSFSIEEGDPFIICSDNQGFEASLCSNKGSPLKLNQDVSKGHIKLEIPASVLYTLRFHFTGGAVSNEKLKVRVDGRPLQTLPLPINLQANPEGNYLSFGPLQMSKGEHSLELELLSAAKQTEVRIENLELEPLFSDTNLLTPENFSNTSTVDVLTFSKGSNFEASLDLYGYNYNFYDLYLNGSTDSSEPFPVEVFVNNQSVGQINLNNKTETSPLPVELSNGGKYKLRLRSASTSETNKALLYSVKLVKHVRGDVIAATRFSWDKKYNKLIHSNLSILSFPQNTPLNYKIQLYFNSYYDLLFKVRNPTGTDAQVNLNLNVEDWRTYQQTVNLNSQWSEIHFKVFLGPKSNNLEISWMGNEQLKSLDFMYIQIK